MADISGAVSTITSGSRSALFTTVWISIVIIGVCFVLMIIAFLVWRKNKYNLIVEIKLPRNDGRIINAELGVGSYDSKRGVVLIKRKKGRAIPMKIFDVKRYLQGTNLLTVIQLGSEDYRPVLNNSWTEHEVEYNDETKPLLDDKDDPIFDEDGNPMYEKTIIKESILNIKTETEHNKAWKSAWEEAAKQAYTIQNILRQYQTPISIGIVVICCFIGFAILWTKLSGVCG